MRPIITFILAILFSLSGRLFALTVEVERIDTGKAYSAITDTGAVLYVDRCARGKCTTGAGPVSRSCARRGGTSRCRFT